jgi:hypothetical protein
MDMKQEVDYETTMSGMFKEAQTPLYEGCPNSCLATILLLLNLCNTHGINNMFADELFSLLRLDLFPKDNTLPKSLYEVNTIVKRLGLNYNLIHACYNGCVLFKGELKDSKACPKCKRSRYIERSYNVPCKVFCHFPLIPRLKQMYRCPTLVDLMVWHNANKSNDGLICYVCDLKAWKHIDTTWLDFAKGPHNIRLGVAFDGVNPYANLSTNHLHGQSYSSTTICHLG